VCIVHSESGKGITGFVCQADTRVCVCEECEREEKWWRSFTKAHAVKAPFPSLQGTNEALACTRCTLTVPITSFRLRLSAPLPLSRASEFYWPSLFFEYSKRVSLFFFGGGGVAHHRHYQSQKKKKKLYPLVGIRGRGGSHAQTQQCCKQKLQEV
jgi:hypothetical protein